MAFPSVVITDVIQRTSDIDFIHSWPRPTIGTQRSFASNSIGVHADISTGKHAKKVTPITVDEADESQRIVTSAVKRLSTEELEDMVQRQLIKVIDGHRYNAWLWKQVDDTDVQLAKYQNRIDALQKHINDLAVVIHKHTNRSEGTHSPPMKLMRNVGLQVRIKQASRPAYEVSQLPNNMFLEEESSALHGGASAPYTGKKQETPTSTLTTRKNQHYSVKPNEVCGRVGSHQTSSPPVEINLAQFDNKAANERPINPSVRTSLPIDEAAILLPRRTLPSQTRVAPALISVSCCATFPSSALIQAMDLTTDRTIPLITGDYVELNAPSVPKDKPENPNGFVLNERRSPLEQSVRLAGSNPPAGTKIHLERQAIRTVIMPPSSCKVTASCSLSSFPTDPPAGSSAQNIPVPQKSPSNALYSHPDRKRRLPCGLTSLNASTIASIEKHHKQIKEHWYDPQTHHGSGLPSHIHPAMPNGNLRLKQFNQLLNSKAIASSPIAPVATRIPIQIRRKSTTKQTQQQAFEKQVKSVGIYRTWKLPMAAGPVQNIPTAHHPLLLKPQRQQVQQFQNVPKRNPPNPPLSDPLLLQEDHLTRKRCLSDLYGTI